MSGLFLLLALVCLFVGVLGWLLLGYRPRHGVASLAAWLDGGQAVDATTVAGSHAGRSVRIVSGAALEYRLAIAPEVRGALTREHALLLAADDVDAQASVSHLFTLEDAAVELHGGWLRLRRSATAYAHGPSSVKKTLVLAEALASVVDRACAGRGRGWALVGSRGVECLACRAPLEAADAAVTECDGCGAVQHERCLAERSGCGVSSCRSHARPHFNTDDGGRILPQEADYLDWLRDMVDRLGGHPSGTPTSYRAHGRWRGHRVCLVRDVGVFGGTFTIRIAARRGSGRLEVDAARVRGLAREAGAQAREASAAVGHLFDRLSVQRLVIEDGWLSVSRADQSDFARSWSSVEAVLDSLEELVPLFSRLEIRVRGPTAGTQVSVERAVKAWEQGGRVLCPFCRDDLGADDVIGCETCETAHHRECLDEGGGCSVFGCASGRRREAGAPERA